MAKIKYSALVSDMRNKLNGSVLSKNRYGSYIRNKVTPVNPQTSYQQSARQILGNLSSSFRELTASQIAQWNAKAKDFPFTDIFGDTRHLTGQTLFVKLNANLEKIGVSRISEAPNPVGFPEYAVTSVAVTPDTGLPDTGQEITIQTSLAAAPSGYTFAVYATPPISKSVSFIKNQFRYIGKGTVGATGRLDIKQDNGDFDYWDRFGEFSVGDVVHVKIALVSNTTGQQSIPVQGSAVAADA